MTRSTAAAAMMAAKRRHESGAALVIVLILLAALAILGTGLATAVTGSARLVKEREEATKAGYAAEAGVDFLVASLDHGLGQKKSEEIIADVLKVKGTVGDSFFRLSENRAPEPNDNSKYKWLAFRVTGAHGSRQVTVDVLVELQEDKKPEDEGPGKGYGQRNDPEGKQKARVINVIWK